MKRQLSAQWRKRMTASRRRHSPLDEATVRAMRVSERKPKELAQALGISQSYVYKILSGANWREVGPSPLTAIAQQAGMLP